MQRGAALVFRSDSIGGNEIRTSTSSFTAGLIIKVMLTKTLRLIKMSILSERSKKCDKERNVAFLISVSPW